MRENLLFQVIERLLRCDRGVVFSDELWLLSTRPEPEISLAGRVVEGEETYLDVAVEENCRNQSAWRKLALVHVLKRSEWGKEEISVRIGEMFPSDLTQHRVTIAR